MRFTGWMLTGLCLVLSAPVANAAETIDIPNCLIMLKEEVMVPAQEAGMLTEVPVVEGQAVRKGEKLSQIDDMIPQAQRHVAENKLKAAEAEANSTVSVKYAKAAADSADADYDQFNDANTRVKGSVTQMKLRELALKAVEMHLATEKAEKDHNVAIHQAGVAQAELEAAEANNKHRTVSSMIDGEVVDVKRHVGEWVAAGDTIMHLVRMDRLRVIGSMKASDYLPSEIAGRPVTITIQLPHGQKETFPGKVVFVSPLVLGGEFEVRAEVDNRKVGNFWILRPGLHVDMKIELN
jgi:multidrug resistance efflux pump